MQERPFYSAGAIKDAPPKTPLDKPAAVAYGAFVNCAYDMFEKPRGGDPCKPDQPADFPSGYRLSAWIDMSDFAVLGEKFRKFYGFVATELADPWSHVIAIRGTEGAVEWWDDAMIWPARFRPVPEAGRVHGGFYRIYHTMRTYRVPHPIVPGSIHPDAQTQPQQLAPNQTFAEQIEHLVSTIPTPQTAEEHHHHFIVTGHSLGAALCTLYVMEHAIRKERGEHRRVMIERVCTFASPRVGLPAFKRAFDALPIDAWRLVNTQDIVPMVPPPFPVPFRHVDTEYAFSSAGVVKWSPSCWHSMLTYMHWLDPDVAIRSDCRR